MEYSVLPSRFFLDQLEHLSEASKRLLEEKIRLIKINPYRNKRVQGYGLFLFRIRFENERKEKRAVYLVDKPFVKMLCILDRNNDYKELKNYLKLLGYL